MNDNLASYSTFAPYYRTLLSHRSHAEPIARLLTELLTPAHHRLLDAACGQGNLSYFEELPGRTVYGSDGSHHMIEFLKADPTLASRYEHVIECEWKALPSLFRAHGKFDAIFFLGNAISHVRNLDELRQIVADCRVRGLNDGGLLIFDMREWRLEDGGSGLTEPGRTENVKRLILREEPGDVCLQIFDECRYNSDHQIIDYYVEEDGKPIAEAEFSYLMVRPKEVISLVESVGFEIRYSGKPDNYPYFAICGEAIT
ncbi:MAG: class I SAM-dependent methyltransferase [Acidobacteria bacterium]|nr:class I SAM-dependent methyltransferase [Acidobacteriota bacterium]